MRKLCVGGHRRTRPGGHSTPRNWQRYRRWESRVGELSWEARTMRKEAGQATGGNQRPMCARALRSFSNNLVQSIYFTHTKTEAREITCPAQDQQWASPSTPEHKSSDSGAFWGLPGNRHGLLNVSCEGECYKQETGFNVWLVTLRHQRLREWINRAVAIDR